MKILKEIYSPSETTYTVAKYAPFMGGFGAAIIFFLPGPIWIIWLLLVLILSNTIIIRGAMTLPVDEERIRARKENPPKFSAFSYSFLLLLPFLALVLLFYSSKFFAIAFMSLSTMSILLLGAIDFSVKRVLLTSIALIAFSLIILFQFSAKSIFIYCIMIVFAIPKSVEACIENKNLLFELTKANTKINRTETAS